SRRLRTILPMAAWATSLKFSTATRPSGLAAVSRRRGAWQKYCGRWWRMFTDCGRCYSRRFQLRRPERPPPCGLRYPAARDQRADLLPLEGEVRRDGQRRGQEAEATGRREPEAEARGGRADAG